MGELQGDGLSLGQQSFGGAVAGCKQNGSTHLFALLPAAPDAKSASAALASAARAAGSWPVHTCRGWGWHSKFSSRVRGVHAEHACRRARIPQGSRHQQAEEHSAGGWLACSRPAWAHSSWPLGCRLQMAASTKAACGRAGQGWGMAAQLEPGAGGDAYSRWPPRQAGKQPHHVKRQPPSHTATQAATQPNPPVRATLGRPPGPAIPGV
jgi:hypothetical protein